MELLLIVESRQNDSINLAGVTVLGVHSPACFLSRADFNAHRDNEPEKNARGWARRVRQIVPLYLLRFFNAKSQSRKAAKQRNLSSSLGLSVAKRYPEQGRTNPYAALAPPARRIYFP
jgi:hypothetical protein